MFNIEKRKVKCDKCGHKFTQTVTSGVIVVYKPSSCPECGSHRISPSLGFFDTILDLFG